MPTDNNTHFYFIFKFLFHLSYLTYLSNSNQEEPERGNHH